MAKAPQRYPVARASLAANSTRVLSASDWSVSSVEPASFSPESHSFFSESSAASSGNTSADWCRWSSLSSPTVLRPRNTASHLPPSFPRHTVVSNGRADPYRILHPVAPPPPPSTAPSESYPIPSTYLHPCRPAPTPTFGLLLHPLTSSQLLLLQF